MTTKNWKFIKPPSVSSHGRSLVWTDCPEAHPFAINWIARRPRFPLNIAEGNGKFTSPDRCRFFDNARGSALESAACLDVMVAKRFVDTEEIETGKAMLVKIVSMLFGLIRANSDVRVFEETASYGVAEKRKENRNRSKNTR